jgi:hypothetical protein
VQESSVAQDAVELRFRGAWLARLGFRPGARVLVSNPDAGRLVLTLDSPPQLRSEDFVNLLDRLTKATANA